MITFVPSGRGRAQCEPDPNYPNGIEINSELKGPSCKFDIPYPAAECGLWLITCDTCGMKLMVTAAGRVDDPKSVRVPCQFKVLQQ